MAGPILLFGAAGQVGRELTGLARARGIDLAAATRADADITDAAAVGALVEHKRPVLVVNAAAYTAVDRAEQEPELVNAVNAFGASHVAAAAAAVGAALLHISTDYVFDGTRTGPYVETDPIAPLGAYGRSKAEGEALVRTAHTAPIILRTAWVYGRYGHNFLKTMLRLAATREEIRVVDDQVGCPTATADIAEAILAVHRALAQGPLPGGTFHFAGNGATTWYGFAGEILDRLEERTGRRVRLVPIPTAEYPTPARRPANSQLDSTLFATTFGLRAAPRLQRVHACVDALLNDTGD